MGDNSKKKKGRFERLADWGYKWQMKPFKELSKNVTEGAIEGTATKKPSPEEARSILKLRLAKGEISKEQYEELKKIIED